MPKIRDRGSLIKCSKANKTFIRHLNSIAREEFIMCELDDNHLVIKDSYVDYVKNELYAMQDENSEDTNNQNNK